MYIHPSSIVLLQRLYFSMISSGTSLYFDFGKFELFQGSHEVEIGKVGAHELGSPAVMTLSRNILMYSWWPVSSDVNWVVD